MKTRLGTYFILGIFGVCLSVNLARPEETTAPSNLQRIRAGQLHKLHRKAARFKVEGEWNKAIDAYREILLAEPDDEVAYTNLGSIYMIQGNFARADDAFKNALHINPDNEVALLGLQKIHDPDNPIFRNEDTDEILTS